MYSLSGYGFMDIGLPPASPSEKDIDLKVYGIFNILQHILQDKEVILWVKGSMSKTPFPPFNWLSWKLARQMVRLSQSKVTLEKYHLNICLTFVKLIRIKSMVDRVYT